MHNYSTQELADVIFAYGNAYGNASQAAQIYQERYPESLSPLHDLYSYVCSFTGNSEITLKL